MRALQWFGKMWISNPGVILPNSILRTIARGAPSIKEINSFWQLVGSWSGFEDFSHELLQLILDIKTNERNQKERLEETRRTAIRLRQEQQAAREAHRQACLQDVQSQKQAQEEIKIQRAAERQKHRAQVRIRNQYESKQACTNTEQYQKLHEPVQISRAEQENTANTPQSYHAEFIESSYQNDIQNTLWPSQMTVRAQSPHPLEESPNLLNKRKTNIDLKINGQRLRTGRITKPSYRLLY